MPSVKEWMLPIREKSESVYGEAIRKLQYSEDITKKNISVLECGLVPPEEVDALIKTGNCISDSILHLIDSFEHGKDRIASIREPDELNKITNIDELIDAEISTLTDISAQHDLASHLKIWFDESVHVLDRWSRDRTQNEIHTSQHSWLDSFCDELMRDIAYAIKATEEVVFAMKEWRDYLYQDIPPYRECPPHRNFD